MAHSGNFLHKRGYGLILISKIIFWIILFFKYYYFLQFTMENTGRELLSCSELDNISISLSSSALELSFSNSLEYHIKNYPKITLRDIYKFFHQGTCGWSHLTQSSSLRSIKRRLIEESSIVGSERNGELFRNVWCSKTI